MRYKSNQQNGYTVYAVAGTDIVSFGIDFTQADIKGLLGFAVERHDISESEKYFMKGFKVFKEIFPNPTENLLVSTNEHPIQSFVWDDFTAKPGHEYEYFFYPLKGKPKFLDRKQPILIKVKTEPLFSTQPEEHDIFFNRGVASSQEYTRKFHNLPPDKITNPEMKADAYSWLSRELKNAFYSFIDRAKAGDSLVGSFYEFHFPEAVAKFKEAIDRGVNVHLIVDCKKNEHTTTSKKTGKQTFHPSFPKEANLQALEDAGITNANFTQRTARVSAISHNKFLVYQPKNSENPTEVWMGSTNISEGGLFGQTNVGHWIKNEDIAIKYKQYWELLKTDPGAKEDSEHTRAENTTFKNNVEKIAVDISIDDIANSAETIIPVFSPRNGLDMLDTYFELIDKTATSACITLAFGVSKVLKDKLLDNTFKNSIVFMLLEKKDEANPRSKDKDAFVALNAKNNVYEAYGSFISDTLNKWVRETDTQRIGLNTHVKYIHTKFLLHDPLSANPIVVTGSANFSDASTKENDENMVIIKDNIRTADIYFTEFNRLFNHYYFRSVLEELKLQGITIDGDSLFLTSDDSWLEKYKPGKLRRKRVEMYSNMAGVTTL